MIGALYLLLLAMLARAAAVPAALLDKRSKDTLRMRFEVEALALARLPRAPMLRALLPRPSSESRASARDATEHSARAAP